MKRKKKKALILSVFMILLLAACSSRTNVRDGDDYIYCLNPDKTGLLKVSYEVQGEDVVEEAKDILREMQKPPGIHRLFPKRSKYRTANSGEVSWMLISIANTDR